MKINIALTIPFEVENELISISQKISENYETYFTLSNLKDSPYKPHVSIYKSEFLNVKLTDIVETVRNLIKITSAPVLQTTGLGFTNTKGYIYIAIDKNNSLLDLHTNIINKLSPFISIDIDEKLKSLSNNSPTKISKYLHQYGSVNIKEFFDPHITLTQLVNENQVQELSQNINFNTKHFKAGSLQIYINNNEEIFREKLTSD